MELIATNDDVVFFSMKFSVRHRKPNGTAIEERKGRENERFRHSSSIN